VRDKGYRIRDEVEVEGYRVWGKGYRVTGNG